ncbi:MAG: LysR family transcriptional regulator [Persephonella sp.]|nr:LysR family transcriptional regulator [Persephonella sp.]
MGDDVEYHIKFKLWIEKDGDIIIGLGRDKLLGEIEKTGSISKAAKNVGMSYKKAWSFLKTMENRLGVKLIKTRRGGKKGGGTELTEDAKKLLAEFEKISTAFENLKEQLEKNG